MWLLVPVAAAGALHFSAPDSTVRFQVDSSLDVVAGTARSFTGDIDPAAGTGRLEIPTRALGTGLGPRDARLLDYALEASRFPAIQATLRGAEDLGKRTSGDAALNVEVTLRDITRPVEIHTHYSWEGDTLRLSGMVDLQWADFGIPDPSVLVATVGPTVSIRFELVARPPTPSTAAPSPAGDAHPGAR